MLMLLHVQGQVQPLWGVWSCRGALKRHHYGILPTAPLGAAQEAFKDFEGKAFTRLSRTLKALTRPQGTPKAFTRLSRREALRGLFTSKVKARPKASGQSVTNLAQDHSGSCARSSARG